MTNASTASGVGGTKRTAVAKELRVVLTAHRSSYPLATVHLCAALLRPLLPAVFAAMTVKAKAKPKAKPIPARRSGQSLPLRSRGPERAPAFGVSGQLGGMGTRLKNRGQLPR